VARLVRARVPLGERDVIVLIRGGGRARESRAFAILDGLLKRSFCVLQARWQRRRRVVIRGDPRVNLVSPGVNPVVNWQPIWTDQGESLFSVYHRAAHGPPSPSYVDAPLYPTLPPSSSPFLALHRLVPPSSSPASAFFRRLYRYRGENRDGTTRPETLRLAAVSLSLFLSTTDCGLERTARCFERSPDIWQRAHGIGSPRARRYTCPLIGRPLERDTAGNKAFAISRVIFVAFTSVFFIARERERFILTAWQTKLFLEPPAFLARFLAERHLHVLETPPRYFRALPRRIAVELALPHCYVVGSWS